METKTTFFRVGYQVAKLTSCWQDGTPKLRKSSADIPEGSHADKNKSSKTRQYRMRRSSESDLRNVRLKPTIRIDSPSSRSASSASEDNYSDSDTEQLFETAEGSVEEVINASEHSENVSVSSGTSIESVSGHFRNLFIQLEDYMKTADDEKERSMIRKRMNKMKDTMSTINRMFDDLLNDGDRLEKYLILMDGTNNNNNA